MTLVIHTPVAALNSSLFFPSSDNNSSSSSRRRPATAAAPPPLDDQPLSRSTHLRQRSARWTKPPPSSLILLPPSSPISRSRSSHLFSCPGAADRRQRISCPCSRQRISCPCSPCRRRRSCSSLRASWLRHSCHHQPRHGAGRAARSAADGTYLLVVAISTLVRALGCLAAVPTVALMAALKNRHSISSICAKLAAIIITPIFWSSPSSHRSSGRYPLRHRNVHHGRQLVKKNIRWCKFNHETLEFPRRRTCKTLS